MAPSNWNRSFGRFARAGGLVAVVCVAALALHGDRAEACGGWDPSIVELTTFDPGVLGDDTFGGLAYDPFDAGFGSCPDCATNAMLEDWRGFLGDAVTPADWRKVLLEASLDDVLAIEQRLAGNTHAAPPGYEGSSLWSKPAAAGKLSRALALVELLKRMAPQITFSEWSDTPRPAPRTTLGEELAAARRGLAATKEPFLRQRYAFATLRALFYREEWASAVAFFDANTRALAAPSNDLEWRARHYVAGALRRRGQLARAHLELARIHAGYGPLAGAAVLDFRPVDDASCAR